MIKNWKSRLEICTIPWILPVLLLFPYAIFVGNFRLLRWVAENAYLPFWGLLAFSFLSAIVSCTFLLRAHVWGQKIFITSAFLLLAHSSFLAMRERRHFILVALFLLCVIVVFLSERLRRKLSKPYFSSRRSWCESVPASVPGILAYVEYSGGETEWKEVFPSHLGEEGCFIFLKDGFFQKAPQRIILKNNDAIIVECGVELAYLTKDKTGAGLIYLDNEENAGDWNKDYFDHLHFLRRAGYEK